MEMSDKKGGVVPALFLFSIFLLSIFKIKSYDLWWHLKAGELAVGSGFKPAPTNIFSWAEPDYPWVNFSWLFDVIVYLIHKAAGFNGLIIFQAALVTAVFFVVYKTLKAGDSPDSTPPFVPPLARGGLRRGGRKSGTVPLFALFLIAYFAARFRFSLRPHLLALLFFAIDVYLLNRLSAIRNPQSAFRSPIYLIPLLQILWANTHGSAILGVLLPAIFIIGDILNPPQSYPKGHKPFAKGGRRGVFFFLLLLTITASFVNPYGYKVLTDPFAPFFGQGADLFNTLTVDEWQMAPKDMFLGWYGLLLLIGVASFFPSFVETPRRAISTDLLLFSLFAVLSIKAVRFIDLFAVAAVPVMYKNLAGGQWSVVSEESQKINYHPSSLILHPFLILTLFWFLGIRDTTFSPGLGIDNEFIPERAVKFMEKNGIQGKIFNSYNSGGYLIYKGYTVFMDGRLSYSQGIVKEFADANLKVSGWKRVEEKYKPEIVLIEYDKPAIPETLLRDKQNWALVYWDDLGMLFLRRDDRFSDMIAKNEYGYLNPMNMYGRGDLPSTGGRGLRGGGDILFWEEAIFTEAQRRLNDGPDSMRAHLLLGNLYLSRGEAEKAAGEYAAVIDSPLAFGKAEAHNNLGTAFERMDDTFDAEMEYKAAIRLDKAYPLPQRNLGYLKLGQSRYIEALWNLERYLRSDNGNNEIRSLVYDLKKYRDVLILRTLIGGGAVLGILWMVVRRFNAVKHEA